MSANDISIRIAGNFGQLAKVVLDFLSIDTSSINFKLHLIVKTVRTVTFFFQLNKRQILRMYYRSRDFKKLKIYRSKP